MTISIDRQAISDTIYDGSAVPAGLIIYSVGMDEYQYPYDPEAAKQLLAEAGYPDGFSFNAISYHVPAQPETPRIMEILASYWQQIGLDPKIVAVDFNAYNSNYRHNLKTAGNLSLYRLSAKGDNLARIEADFMPNGLAIIYQDEGSVAIWKESLKSTLEERLVLVDKLNQHYYENYGPIPLLRVGMCYAWNSDKISPWPHSFNAQPAYFEYVRHAQPLNTFRLFNLWPDR